MDGFLVPYHNFVTSQFAYCNCCMGCEICIYTITSYITASSELLLLRMGITRKK
ncbi:hypothetical protein SETIT_7G029900v2 [Setaria italica]|uniref:Uncharacterized protein n=2 Tax=Setaria TaxID=4554 RepID=A0A368RRA6_SETIT|nr:hypothetical protein SETIT_7G029900v2 [Setaria italica]TKW21277.1 hypothetical protein SEVIR_4G169801v2 [Setaria viridis]TKW23907.1 hypothetical protein SEVIR_3G017701v2 [Setaria viridis]TKW23908.1 hypothetical protein SEVIR_3G017701v2 [Setaria viridis]TKW23909.1 hypothetical protein SEVIR_3G017701v2 [Setaria viridis]